MSRGIAKHETGTTLGNHPELYPYVMDHIGETPVQRELRDSIVKLERSTMMGSPDEAQFLGWLIGLTGAKRVIEVGVFRGSTTLAMALQMGNGGTIYGLDVSSEFAELGRAAWAQAGVADRIDFRVGPAIASLEHMLNNEGLEGTIDMVFIDADKANYATYYELSLRLLRAGGVIVVDNVLWHGEVLLPTEQQTVDCATIVALNETIKSDPRVHAVLLPIADGAYMVRKL